MSYRPDVPASVANVATLAALGGQDGDSALVASLLCTFSYVAGGAALAIDHITVEETADGGDTRWVRAPEASPVWGAQASWQIDPVAGSDENPGTAAAPIQTLAELARRVTGQDGCWVVTANVDVSFSSYPPTSDPLRLDVKFHQIVLPDESGNGPVLTFNAPAFTAFGAGTFTAITPRNRVTNTPWDMTDATIPSTTAWPLLRCRVTSGPRAGIRAWVAKSTGASSWRTSEWVSWSGGAGGVIARATPLVGDPYVVEGSTAAPITDHGADLHVDFIRVRPGTGAPWPGGATLIFNGFDLHPVTMNATLPIQNDGCALIFQDCLFKHGEYNVWTRSASGDYIAGFTYFANCATIGFSGGGIGNLIFRSGLFTENFVDGGCFAGQVVASQAAGATIEFDALFQAGAAAVPPPTVVGGGSLCLVTAGVMDWGAYGGLIVIDAVCGLNLQNDAEGPHLWGQTATAGAYGATVRAGGTLRYIPGSQITITGPAGDFALGSATSARAWDEGAGAYTAALPCTWANVIGGALLDNAHNLKQDAHVYLNDGSPWLQAQP